MTDSDWDKYKKLVLQELERNNDQLNNIDLRLRVIEERLTIINTKIYLAAFMTSAVITGVIQYIVNVS